MRSCHFGGISIQEVHRLGVVIFQHGLIFDFLSHGLLFRDELILAREVGYAKVKGRVHFSGKPAALLGLL